MCESVAEGGDLLVDLANVVVVVRHQTLLEEPLNVCSGSGSVRIALGAGLDV